MPLDPATGLVTREHAEKVLTQLTAADSDQLPLTVALVELAPLDWIGEQPNSVIDKRLLCGVSNVVRQSLADDHTLARNSASSSFCCSCPTRTCSTRRGARRKCASAWRRRNSWPTAGPFKRPSPVRSPKSRTSGADQKLFEFLQEALGEAKRYGGNRTFTHDGSSPTPVVPTELSVAPQQLAI